MTKGQIVQRTAEVENRISVRELAIWLHRQGKSPKEIQKEYPSLFTLKKGRLRLTGEASQTFVPKEVSRPRVIL